jgi:polysaccharide biosynthesis transport protein
MNLERFLLIILARRHLATAVFLLTALAGTAITLLMPRSYTATTSIVVDVKVDPIAGILMPTVGTPAYMATQTEIIQSERNAIGVVKLLNLDQDAKRVEQWREATGGRVPFESYLAGRLRKGLKASPTRGSNIITLEFSADDPKFAMMVVNAFAQSYVDLTIDLRVEPARQYATWFDERLKALRSNVEKAQAKLNAYRRERVIVVSDDRVDQEAQRLNSLMAELTAIESQRVDSSSRLRTSGSELSPDVLQNPIIQGLKSELARVETKLNEVSGNVGENHPLRIQLERQAEGLKDQLTMEMRRISGGAATSSKTSQLKEGELRGLIERQKRQVVELRAQRDEMGVLVKDVETAQRAYDSVAQRMTQLNLESHSEQANVRVLSPAVEPVEPSRPKIPIYLLGSLLLGVLTAFGAALGLEILDRRVWVAMDLWAENLPLLGVLTSRPSFGDRWRQSLSFLSGMK